MTRRGDQAAERGQRGVRCSGKDKTHGHSVGTSAEITEVKGSGDGRRTLIAVVLVVVEDLDTTPSTLRYLSSSSARRAISPPARTSLTCRGERRCRTVKEESLVTLSTFRVS